MWRPAGIEIVLYSRSVEFYVRTYVPTYVRTYPISSGLVQVCSTRTPFESGTVMVPASALIRKIRMNVCLSLVCACDWPYELGYYVSQTYVRTYVRTIFRSSIWCSIFQVSLRKSSAALLYARKPSYESVSSHRNNAASSADWVPDTVDAARSFWNTKSLM